MRTIAAAAIAAVGVLSLAACNGGDGDGGDSFDDKRAERLWDSLSNSEQHSFCLDFEIDAEYARDVFQNTISGEARYWRAFRSILQDEC